MLGYWYPADRKGAVGTDMMAIPHTAQKPVLAHMFLNHLLDNDTALSNFEYTGYQPALSIVDAGEDGRRRVRRREHREHDRHAGALRRRCPAPAAVPGR